MNKLKSLLTGVALLASASVWAATYTAPSGESYTNNYLTHITSSGGKENIDLSYTSNPGIYNEITGIEAEPDTPITLNLTAYSAGASTTSVNEDLRYTAAHFFHDLDGSGNFVRSTRYGTCPPSNNIAGNHATVMNISHSFTVPATAVPGTELRVRVVYQNAWKHTDITEDGVTIKTVDPNCSDLDKGIAYDFVISVAAPLYYGIDLPEGEKVLVNNTHGSVANNVWTSNTTVTHGVKFTMGSGFHEFNGEWIKLTPNGGPRTYTIESTDPAYYVKAFIFTAVNNEAENPADFTLASATREGICTKDNNVILYDLDIEEGTPATFTIGCTNTEAKKLTLQDFEVILAEATPAPEPAQNPTPDPVPETGIDYAAGITTSSKGQGRYTGSLELTAKEGDIVFYTTNITGMQTSTTTSGAEGAKIYWDKSADILSIKPGQTLHIKPTGSGEWMQQYVYIDWNGDGFAYESEDTYLVNRSDYVPELKPGSELIYFSSYAKDHYSSSTDKTGWYYLDGTPLTNNTAHDDRNTNYQHEIDINIPENTSAGYYRARYKIDWRNVDPTGATSSDLVAHGGIIVDFTIYVNNVKEDCYDSFVADIERYANHGFEMEGDDWSLEETKAALMESVNDATLGNDDFQGEILNAYNSILSKATPKSLVRVQCKDGYYMHGADETLGFATEHNSPATLWYVAYEGDGKFSLKNYYNQQYLAQPANAYAAIPFAANAGNLEFHMLADDDYFGIHHGHDTHPYIQHAKGTTYNSWDKLSSTYTRWALCAFAGVSISDQTTEAEYADGTLTITFKDADGNDLTAHENRAAHMEITIESAGQGAGASAPMRRTISPTVEGNVLTVNDLSEGIYTVNIPAGYFTNGSELTDAQQINVNASESGATVTSISEVDVEAAEPNAVYDLQGRRLVAPVKGINIINGKKVLVK